MKILYLAGMGHSGSTLLELILATSPGTMATGELEFLSDYLGDPDAPEMDKHPQKGCTCGKKFNKCVLWKKILKNIDKEKIYDYNSGFWNKFKIATSMYLPISAKFDTKGHEKLFKEISRHSKAKIIIDSSMDFRRLTYLSQIPGVDLQVIHMIRDGRAVVNSFEKKDNRFWLITPIQWTMVNVLTRRFLKKVKKVYSLSYDDFCKNPEKHLRAINKKFDLKIDVKKYIANVNKQKYHQVGGNKMNLQKLKGIRYDESWKKRMPGWKKSILTVLTSVQNKRWL